MHEQFTEIPSIPADGTQTIPPGTFDVVDREQVEAAIVEVTRCDPSEDDLRQVAAKLAAGGWPLTGFHD